MNNANYKIHRLIYNTEMVLCRFEQVQHNNINETLDGFTVLLKGGNLYSYSPYISMNLSGKIFV